jgi:hypothetical protein
LEHQKILDKYYKKIKEYLTIYEMLNNKKIFNKIIRYILRHSCAKTLSRKYRLKSRKKTFKKFGKNLAAKN